jgi:hypothetical protein
MVICPNKKLFSGNRKKIGAIPSELPTEQLRFFTIARI